MPAPSCSGQLRTKTFPLVPRPPKSPRTSSQVSVAVTDVWRTRAVRFKFCGVVVLPTKVSGVLNPLKVPGMVSLLSVQLCSLVVTAAPVPALPPPGVARICAVAVPPTTALSGWKLTTEPGAGAKVRDGGWGKVPAGQITGQVRVDPGLPPGNSVQLKVATLVATPEVHERFRVVGGEVGVKLGDCGVTVNALAALPTKLQLTPLVARVPPPMPPLGVTRT